MKHVMFPLSNEELGKKVMFPSSNVSVTGDNNSVTVGDSNETEIYDAKYHFIKSCNQIAKEIHLTCVEKGFWEEGTKRNQGEMLALIHSEVSEALEALRHGNPPDDKVPEYSGMEAELADIVVRIFDMAAGFNYNVAGALIAKIAMNKTRPYKHGKVC